MRRWNGMSLLKARLFGIKHIINLLLIIVKFNTNDPVFSNVLSIEQVFGGGGQNNSTSS